METAREHALIPWRRLDVLVAAEFDAFEAQRPSAARRHNAPDDPEADETLEAIEDMDAAPDDEEAFIERTADWLRGRVDAEALLDAVRTALAETAEEPTARPPQEPPPESVAAPIEGEAEPGDDRAD